MEPTEFLNKMAEIGVVLLMFSAGLETDLKELMKTGPIAFLIACAGVFVPLGGGCLLHMAFYGFNPIHNPHFVTSLFIGVIMTATSVSITVETLKELGYLKSRVGTTVLAAAIIDDIIGRYSKAWKKERLSKTTLSVLRCAICEILYMDDIPDSASVNEAVELFKAYMGKDYPDENING